jgi:hypothetical protein
MRHPVGGIHEDSPGLPGRVAVLPSGAALAQVDYDRHVVFDNSLADCSWYYNHSHVVAPSELDGWATLKGEKANILFGWLYPCVYCTLG